MSRNKTCLFKATFKIEPGTINTFVNAYSYMVIRSSLKKINCVDNFYLDGILLVWILRLFGFKAKRYSFDMTSVAPMVFDEAIKNNLRIYLIGSSENEIGMAVKNIRKEYPTLKIVGVRNGYFDNVSQRNEVIKEIIDKTPDVVIAGMGAPRQEQFIISLRENGWTGIGYTCGGFYHQTARSVNYYPKIMDKLHLRWAFRIVKEPKLIGRYFFSYPMGILLLCKDMIRNKPFNCDRKLP